MWNSECSNGDYCTNYSSCDFKTGGIAECLNTVAHSHHINPAALATIASLETFGGSDPEYKNCENCSGGVGVCQVEQTMFNEWNAYYGGIYTWCSSICGDHYCNNLAICAEFLYAVFCELLNQGYTDSTQMMAMAGTAWNGCSCKNNDRYFSYSCYPWAGRKSFIIPNLNQLTKYGASAGYLFSNSGYVGDFGVLDTSVCL